MLKKYNAMSAFNKGNRFAPRNENVDLTLRWRDRPFTLLAPG
jgi:hypothetical protein